MVMKDIKNGNEWISPRELLEMAGMTEKSPEYFRYILNRLTDANVNLIIHNNAYELLRSIGVLSRC